MFTVLITRKLTPEEFGLWAIMGSMISYFLIVEPIISYWTTREIARGKNIGTTSLMMSLLFSLGSIPLYVVASFYVSDINQTSFNVMLLGIFLIPCFFISQTLVGINQGHKPHATSYGTLIFETLKIPIGLGFVLYLQLGIEGAIFTTLLAYLIRIIIQFYYAKPKLKLNFDFYLVKNWFKLSPITLYSTLPHFIWSLDVMLFSIITTSSIGIAYYAISLTIASIIGHSSMISQALYPKLLSGGSHDHVNQNLIRLFYFAIPLLGVVILFSKPALFVLNPIYDGLSVIVIFLAIRTFFYVINAIFYQILLGIETVDENYNTAFTKFLRSKLFTIPTIQNIHYVCYIVILVTVIFFLHENQYEIKELILIWSIISASLSIPFVIFTGILVSKSVKFKIPYKKIVIYGFVTLLMAITYFMISDYVITYDQNFFVMMPTIFFMLIICALVYVVVTYLLDSSTKLFWNSVLREFIKFKK